MKIVVSGSTGLIGSALTSALTRRGDKVVPLVRRRVAPGEQALAWDPERGTIDRAGLESADAVIHLAGENVFGRWSPAKKQRIYDSRVKGTRLVSDALAGLRRPPATLLAAWREAGAGRQARRTPDGCLSRDCRKSAVFSP